MFGRYALRATEAEFEGHFKPKQRLVLHPRYNISPFETVPTLLGEDRVLLFMRWGLVPNWSSRFEPESGLFNLDLDLLMQKPGFKRLLESKRCLIPADGFYCWKAFGNKKYPYFFSLPAFPVFAFAAIWDTWQAPNGEKFDSFAIITREIGTINSSKEGAARFPIILDPKHYVMWLQQKKVTAETLLPLLQGDQSIQLQVFPVSTAVNNPKNNTPQCVVPLVE